MPQTAEKDRERYYARRKQGLCSLCGVIPTKFARCTFCRDANNARRRGKQKLRREWRRSYYRKRREAGQCVMCGVPSTCARCDFCRARFNSQRREQNWEAKYDKLYRESRTQAVAGKEGDK